MIRLALVLLIAITVFAQKATLPFVIDGTKPYVYLKFDHTGPRKPVFEGEVREGLWLRLVNNSRIPIRVGTFDPGTDEGMGVIHEVVALRSSLYATTEPSKPPEGYDMEVHSVEVLPPGKSILFSVPLNHVGPKWYLRVQFTLAVSADLGGQPYSYADFFWEHLPTVVRKQ